MCTGQLRTKWQQRGGKPRCRGPRRPRGPYRESCTRHACHSSAKPARGEEGNQAGPRPPANFIAPRDGASPGPKRVAGGRIPGLKVKSRKHLVQRRGSLLLRASTGRSKKNASGSAGSGERNPTGFRRAPINATGAGWAARRPRPRKRGRRPPCATRGRPKRSRSPGGGSRAVGVGWPSDHVVEHVEAWCANSVGNTDRCSAPPPGGGRAPITAPQSPTPAARDTPRARSCALARGRGNGRPNRDRQLPRALGPGVGPPPADCNSSVGVQR